MGGNVEEVAKVAISGALEAAGTIGKTAVQEVKDVLLGVAGGTKEILNAVLPKPSSTKTGDE